MADAKQDMETQMEARLKELEARITEMEGKAKEQTANAAGAYAAFVDDLKTEFGAARTQAEQMSKAGSDHAEQLRKDIEEQIGRTEEKVRKGFHPWEDVKK